jgi:hypothetical protein
MEITADEVHATSDLFMESNSAIGYPRQTSSHSPGCETGQNVVKITFWSVKKYSFIFILKNPKICEKICTGVKELHCYYLQNLQKYRIICVSCSRYLD